MLVGIHVLVIVIEANKKYGRENSNDTNRLNEEIYSSKFQPLVFILNLINPTCIEKGD